MRRFTLPVGGIEVLLDEKMRTGSIKSNLHTLDDSKKYVEYDAAVKAIEALILNHACAKVHITDSRYVEGLQKTVAELTKKYSN